MKKEFYKEIGWHVFVIILFTLLAVVYFSPIVMDGKSLQQGDTQKFVGMAEELLRYDNEENKDIIAWQGNMFSGMPSYHTTVIGAPSNNLSFIGRILSGLDYSSIRIVFIGLVSFYILMYALGVRRWLAVAGAIAFAFASYNLIIIEAGHITKAYVIAYMPLVVAGMLLLFKEKRLWGATLFTFGVAMSIFENHLQITYYLMLLSLVLFIGYVYRSIKEKKYKDFAVTSLIMAACVILAVLPNAANMYANIEMSKTSTRGATELTTTTAEGEKISSGLDKDYAFEWSYQKMELLTLLIPNAYGGGSVGTLDQDSELYKELKSKGAQVGKDVQTYTYWGEKMFTSGPVYFGALVCFLFVFGMFVIRSKYKWWFFGGALFLTFLALGRYMDWFNDIMFHYLPLYNKFRTVEMALVIPGMVFPLIGLWGVKELLADKVDEKEFKRGMIGALSITGGLCLIVWLVPNLLLDFSTPMDAQRQLPDWYQAALMMDRASLASSDALRSLIFILLGAGLMYLYWKSKNKKTMAIVLPVGVGVLILADLWTVDKRFLNDGDFVKEKPHETYKASVADNEILKDTDPSYRVLNLNDPFQETATSYFHKSIGGYHAAKLRRYQELIEHRLGGEVYGMITSLQKAEAIEDVAEAFVSSPSLNMLNARYVIYNPGQPPIQNPFAYGNAWFVSDIKIVENADAEIAALNEISPLKTAVIDKRFADEVKGFTPVVDSMATITLTSYKPNRMEYTSETSTDQLAVFSEIYYQPGWRATIDGKPAPHFRADWTLRAMIVPAGKHEIMFEFYPETYVMAANVSAYSSLLILLMLIGAVVYSILSVYKRKSAAEN